MDIIIGVSIFEIFAWLFVEWHARCVFVSTGYPRRYGHGKSGKRAYTHYKKNWSFVERMLWIPVFKEEYESKYREMAYFSYAHTLFVAIMEFCTFICINFLLSNIKRFICFIIIYFVVFIVRFCHSNAIGRKKY